MLYYCTRCRMDTCGCMVITSVHRTTAVTTSYTHKRLKKVTSRTHCLNLNRTSAFFGTWYYTSTSTTAVQSTTTVQYYVVTGVHSVCRDSSSTERKKSARSFLVFFFFVFFSDLPTAVPDALSIICGVTTDHGPFLWMLWSS